MARLKPCRCGEAKRWLIIKSMEGVCVSCTKCGCKTLTYDTERKAIKEWNNGKVIQTK